MAWFTYLLAWLCFLGAHILPMRPAMRGWLIARLGRRGYIAGFSLLSLLLLFWLIRAAGAVDHLPLWDFGDAGRWLVNLAMPLAILLAAVAAGLSGLVAAFAIWASAHLIANGDVAHVLLFGGMLVFALGGLARAGLPRNLQVTPLRLFLAIGTWAGLILLHPLVTGFSPLP
ncbi:NnrU family protein [Paracoccus seriniphilus]|uniref:NnrU family protein n=1 Tax=Paracoccus seriniphilus TaxID=184748 RepID=UPI00356724AE